jgi:hypothetical protein
MACPLWPFTEQCLFPVYILSSLALQKKWPKKFAPKAFKKNLFNPENAKEGFFCLL